MKKSLRILCHNIQHSLGMDRKINVKRIGDVIRSEKPDLVSIQEVDSGNSRSHGIKQGQVLGEYLKYGYMFGKAINFRGGGYGNLLLYNKETIKLIRSSNQPLPGKERRSCVIGAFSFHDIKIDFYATHFCLAESNRIESINILDGISKKSKCDLSILAGDLNCYRNSNTVKHLERKGWIDTNIKNIHLPTFSTKNPKYQIDFVYTKLGNDNISVAVKETKVINQTKESKIASDHFPLFVDLEFVL